MRKSILIACIALIAFVASNGELAYAEVITIEVEGIVNMITTRGGLALDDSVDYGTIMTGSCTYDTETPDQYPQHDWIGRYSLISISMTIGSYTFIHDPESSSDPRFIIVTDDVWYNVYSSSPLFYGPCWIDGEPHDLENIDLTLPGIDLMYLDGNDDGTITDALPDVDSFPELSLFDDRREFGVGNDEGALGFIISGEIMSITVIPEPGAILLLGLGGLALLRKRRR